MKNDLEEIRGILLETKKNPLVLNNYEYIINKVYELLLSNGFSVEIKGEFISSNQEKTLIKVEVENIKKMK